MNKRIGMIVLLICGTMLFLLLSSSVSAQTTIEQNILALVSQDENVPLENLTIANLDTIALPLTGITIHSAKILDTVSGSMYGLAIDQNNLEIDLTAAKQAEKDAYRARYGLLEPKLYDLLQTQTAADWIAVGIWLKAPDVSFPDRPGVQSAPSPLEDGQAPLSLEIPDRATIMNAYEKTPEEIESGLEAAQAEVAERTAAEAEFQAQQEVVYQENLQVLSEQIAAVEAPLLADLRAQGYEPTYVSPYAPLVYFELPKDAIQALNLRSDVDTVYGPQEAHDLMDSARNTQKASFVNNWGYTGAGVDVAILEDSRIEFTNPYIPDGVTRDMGGITDDHAAATAGIVASTDTAYRGIAPGVSLFSADSVTYNDANLAAAMDWSVTQGAHIINNSWGWAEGDGNLIVHDRHLDYIVRNGARTVTVAAGNAAGWCVGTGWVTSPARGFNVISVGNYADQNTLTWTGDLMDSCSSYVDPTTGVEKPELAAVGSNITSTTSASPWIADVGSGTSYSAPMVAGEAALIMQRDTNLKYQPEIIKAMLLATALHNIEGDTRLSEMDGAGGVDMAAAFHTADTFSRSGGGPFLSSSFPLYYYIYASAGETVRVAIAWDSNPAADYSTDPLQADLDLEIYAPGGGLLAGSWSGVNPFEIAEFTAPANGTYEIRVNIWGFTGTSEFVGVAWWTGHRVISIGASQIWNTPPDSRDYYRITPASNHWNVVGIRPPASNDYDLMLYQNSLFGNPSTHTLLAGSYYSSPVDYVAIDNNHAPLASYYPEVYKFSGSGGSYTIEWNGSSTINGDGIYGPNLMTPNHVVRVWDVSMTNGIRKYFAVRPTSGDADLGMALYASTAGDPASWYRGRIDRVVEGDTIGAGTAETMDYLPSVTDRMGLVVYNNGSTTNTSFHLFVDSTAPTGSLTINSGNAYTNSTSVTLNLTGVDAETGLYQMRLSNNGSTWTAWEAYSSTKAWSLAPIDGTKTVFVQIMNHAGMISSSISDTIVVDTVAPTGSMIINSGANYTNSTSVTLTVNATDDRSGLAMMAFGNLDEGWSAWEPYGTSKAWSLQSGDGMKYVYVLFRDNAGNVSSQYSDSIVLDTTAPTGSVSINGGSSYTSNTAVTLTLAATDASSGLYRMRFSNNGSTWTDWEAYTTSKAWTMLAGDGTKTVYVQFQDNILNISGNFTDTIGLDTTPPTGTVSINAGAAFTNSASVTLNLSASDAVSGVAEMRFSNNGADWLGWESYSASKAWSMIAGDGTKIVYVQYRDAVNNTSAAFTDTIVLDTVAPSGGVSINSGSAFTNSTTVTLTLTAADVTSGLYRMRFSNDGVAWSGWEAYATSKVWSLSAGDGTKTVHVQYQDNAVNSSGNFTDTIGLDTTAPTGTISINGGTAYTNSISVTLTLSASDALSGVSQMRHSNDGVTWSGWEAYASSKAWALTIGDGTKTVYIQFRDNAGNGSGNFTDSIGLDTSGPTGSISINSGATYATSTAVALTLSASDAVSGVTHMRFSNDGFAWSDWEAYAVSKSWIILAGDGSKTVFVQYRDGLNNTSPAFTDTIQLDANGPTGTIAINAGASHTNNTSVTLTHSISDIGSSVSQMRFSNDNITFTAWEPYAASKAWVLPAGEGSKQVYAQFEDLNSNLSSVIADGIVIDTTAPTSSVSSPTSVTGLSFTVNWFGTDSSSGIATYDVQYRVGAGGTWTDWLTGSTNTSAVFGPSEPLSVIRDQTYYFQVRAHDNAGNVESYPGGDGDTQTYIEDVVMVYIPLVIK